MRYVKVFIIGLLALISLVFVIENIEVLKTPVELRLNLYVTKLETAPLEVWVITILSFALGAVLVLIYFIYDHIRQRQIIRQLRQNIEIMASELKRAGVPVEPASVVSGTSPEHPEE
jgi:pilus assembly protein TadC